MPPTAANPSASTAPATPGSTYKLVVRSADEAVRTIREQLGDQARVLSVRQLPLRGFTDLFTRPRLEVIAEVGTASSVPVSAPGARGEAAATQGQESLDGMAVEGAPRTRFIAQTPVNLYARAANGTDGAESSAGGPALEAAVRAISAPALRQDQAPQLPDLLRRSGFTPGLIGRLEGTENLADHTTKPLHHTLIDLGQALRGIALRRPTHPLPSRVAFLGTRGVGRTTVLGKLLSRRVQDGTGRGRVWQAEFGQPYPADGLSAYCQALGLKLEHVEFNAAEAAPSEDFLFVDMPGLSAVRPAANRPLRRFLDAAAIPGRVLVLNAVYEQSALRSAYAAGRDMGATHLVLTHLDEMQHWGRLWDFLLDGDLTPLGLSTGPAMAGEFEDDAVTAVLRRTLPGATQPPLS
jgi:flagellar biosynthesis protein FlhF